jgi:gamma-glutamylcyclotransferase (GGCT)/AIG2-like uncharacterized protein YtfP
MNQEDAPEWVFAYGSNLHIADLRSWLRHYGYSDGGIIQVLPALLRDYELVWNYYSPVRKGGAANVRPAQKHKVLGALLEITPETLPGIDKKEGHPARYCRGENRVLVHTLDEKNSFMAWVYEVQSAYQTPEPTPPTQAYLDIMLDGIQQVGLAPSWSQEVRNGLPK